jgi:catechol 2,3-dioxygenase-like lactoylglutathione lyase family enzyme
MKLDKMVGFVITTKPEEAKNFYGDKLGFTFVRDDGFALVFDAHGVMIRVGKAEKITPAPNTVLGWEVSNIVDAVTELRNRGMKFERYEFMHPDPHDICTFPTGDKVAWFKDPDGNVLSLSQHASAAATV